MKIKSITRNKRNNVHYDLTVAKNHNFFANNILVHNCNMPARNVIICGVTRGIEEVDELDIVQELGRSGRPRYDDKAFGYLLVPQGQTQYWKQKIENPRPVTSVMNRKEVLAFHLLAEIYSREVKTEADVFDWFGRTLAHKQNSKFDNDDLRYLLEDLEEMNMITRQDRFIDITNLGKISAWLYLSPYSISSWNRNFGFLFSKRMEIDDYELAWALAKIPDNNIGYVPKEIADEAEDMFRELAMRNLQCGTTVHAVLAAYKCLVGEEMNGGSLGAMMRTLKFDVPRHVQAIKLIDGMYSRWGMDDLWNSLSTRIMYGIPSYLTDLVRIGGVGGKRARLLYEAGARTVEDVASEEFKKTLFKTFRPQMAQSIITNAKKLLKEKKDE